jgi:hypothetical protein
MPELKTLSPDSVPRAVAKAERYRLLNEPAAAESICRDILELEPANQEAVACFILALTDQIPDNHRAWQHALTATARLAEAYERAYYAGIVWERRARALFNEGPRGNHHSIHEWVMCAMRHFEVAEELRPAGNDDPMLRWNTCVRFLRAHSEIAPRVDEAQAAILSE